VAESHMLDVDVRGLGAPVRVATRIWVPHWEAFRARLPQHELLHHGILILTLLLGTEYID
jgi:hypothetical protein